MWDSEENKGLHVFLIQCKYLLSVRSMSSNPAMCAGKNGGFYERMPSTAWKQPGLRGKPTNFEGGGQSPTNELFLFTLKGNVERRYTIIRGQQQKQLDASRWNGSAERAHGQAECFENTEKEHGGSIKRKWKEEEKKWNPQAVVGK